ESVVVGCPVVGPIAEVFESDVGVIGGALLVRKGSDHLAPGLKCTINSTIEHQERAVGESSGKLLDARVNAGPGFALRGAQRRGDQEIRSSREDVCAGVQVKSNPRT